jgi:mono/diheme cytochrome c family protein
MEESAGSDAPENIEKGKTLFHGKAFCATCHGRDGRGLADIPGLRGRLPRNFTDQVWQAARADGELFWILKNGSPGTDTWRPLFHWSLLKRKPGKYCCMYGRSV